MKLGFLTAPFPQTPLMEVADWAAGAGFEVLEIACWPAAGGPTRRYAGTSHIDVANLTDSHATEIVDEIAAKGLSISGLGFYPNGSKSQDENWEVALQVWPDIVKFAQDHGRKITIENCPMIFSRDEWPAGHNIAWSPYIWRRILENWGGTIGLNYDPSHLVWLMIDQERFIKEFGPHILHFQAKDLEIDPDGLYERGTLSGGIGWQVPRLPGLGQVPWARVFAALWKVGYPGDCIIEHEDRKFEKTDELVKRGFLIARDVLRPYVK